MTVSVEIEQAVPTDERFRELLDEYAVAMMPYEPPEWYDAFKPGPDGHVPWPALLSDDPEPGLLPHFIWAFPQRGKGRALAGLLNLKHWEGWDEIRDIFVLPNWRRLGVGRAVVEQLQAHSPQGILCDVLRANEPAIWFWTKMGFERIGESPRWGTAAAPFIGLHAWPAGRFNLGKPS